MGKTIGRMVYPFLCCLLAVPTCVYFLDGMTVDRPETAVFAGAVLGVAHLVLRPLLRAVSAPIGCLTLGLSGLVIDVGLIYALAYFVPGFAVTAFLPALAAALFVNLLCALTGRKH